MKKRALPRDSCMRSVVLKIAPILKTCWDTQKKDQKWKYFKSPSNSACVSSCLLKGGSKLFQANWFSIWFKGIQPPKHTYIHTHTIYMPSRGHSPHLFKKGPAFLLRKCYLILQSSKSKYLMATWMGESHPNWFRILADGWILSY